MHAGMHACLLAVVHFLTLGEVAFLVFSISLAMDDECPKRRSLGCKLSSIDQMMELSNQ